MSMITEHPQNPRPRDFVVPEFYVAPPSLIYDVTPIPIREHKPLSVVFLPMTGPNLPSHMVASLTEWNIAWEAEHLRGDFIRFQTRPQDRHLLKWTKPFMGQNVHIVPYWKDQPAMTYQPLYYLLSRRTLARHGLVPLSRSLWPISVTAAYRNSPLRSGDDRKFAAAFAEHIWPYLIDAPKRAFSADEPIKVLAHEPAFWLPHMVELVHQYMEGLPECTLENPDAGSKINEANAKLEAIAEPYRYRKVHAGGTLWSGEADAAEVTQDLVDYVDRDGRLRGIIDAVRRNRVEDDFSPYWSRAREDFERAFYHKRAKVKVRFVEHDNESPLEGPFTEYVADPADEAVGRVLFNDFLALLDHKSRQIVLILRRGATHSEIATELGFANHTPVTKRIRKIREMARRFFLEDHAL